MEACRHLEFLKYANFRISDDLGPESACSCKIWSRSVERLRSYCKQEIRSVEHGDSAITKGQIAYFSLRMGETAIFLLPVINLTSPSYSLTQICYKIQRLLVSQCLFVCSSVALGITQMVEMQWRYWRRYKCIRLVMLKLFTFQIKQDIPIRQWILHCTLLLRNQSLEKRLPTLWLHLVYNSSKLKLKRESTFCSPKLLGYSPRHNSKLKQRLCKQSKRSCTYNT